MTSLVDVQTHRRAGALSAMTRSPKAMAVWDAIRAPSKPSLLAAAAWATARLTAFES